MHVIFLILIIIGLSTQNITKKAYSRKVHGKGIFFFCALSGATAALFFLFSAKGMDFDPRLLPYSIAFAIAYSCSLVFGTLAVGCGPLSLTALLLSYSLILPTLFGLVFWDEPIGFGLIPGLLLLCLSLLLINKKSKNLPITPRWVFFVALSFLGNGGCSVIQKMQQMNFEGNYKNEFMLMGLGLVVVCLFALSLAREKEVMKECAKKAWWLGVLSGLMNGMVNLFVMVLANLLPASVMFPVISAGGVVVTFFISTLFYKEKLSRKQLLGFFFGAVSIIFLNL